MTKDEAKDKISKFLKSSRSCLKSYVYAPKRSTKGEHRTLFLYGMVGLFIGIGMASVMKANYDAEDRAEAIQQRLLQSATPPPGQGEKRWLALEQLKLLLSK